MGTPNEKVVAGVQDLLGQAQRLLGQVDLRPVKSSAEHLMDTIRANVDNEKLSDAEFREFIRNSLRGLK